MHAMQYHGVTYQHLTTVRDKFLSIILGQVNFSCPQLPPLSQSAKNVYKLRPQDIKVVMAIGDSITAGKKEQQRMH